MNKLKYFLYTGLLAMPELAFAQGIKNPIKSNNILDLLNTLLEIIVKIGLPIIVIFFIFAGFKFVIARGNPDKLKDAKSAILWTTVGAAVLLGAKVLATLIKGTINIF